MNYPDGQEVRIGDKVKLGADHFGRVVCSIDLGQFSDEHPREQWGYLKRGVMIEFSEFGLIYYAEPDPDLLLISRS